MSLPSPSACADGFFLRKIFVSFTKTLLYYVLQKCNSFRKKIVIRNEDIARWNDRFLPCPQESATDLCPEPDESNPHSVTLFKIGFNVLSSPLYLCIPSAYKNVI
jgi:hypothetical protein